MCPRYQRHIHEDWILLFTSWSKHVQLKSEMPSHRESTAKITSTDRENSHISRDAFEESAYIVRWMRRAVQPVNCSPHRAPMEHRISKRLEVTKIMGLFSKSREFVKVNVRKGGCGGVVTNWSWPITIDFQAAIKRTLALSKQLENGMPSVLEQTVARILVKTCVDGGEDCVQHLCRLYGHLHFINRKQTQWEPCKVPASRQCIFHKVVTSFQYMLNICSIANYSTQKKLHYQVCIIYEVVRKKVRCNRFGRGPQ